MTSPRRFEQDLPALLGELYLAGTPDYRDDLVQQTARVPQRPAWTFPERWLPMDLATKVAPSAPRIPWRTIGVLAVIAALLATVMAVYVGSQPRLPAPFGLAQNGGIVYAADGDVFLRETPDGPITPLITSPAVETAAVFSPLGDRLAILREADGGEDVWVAAADGTGLVRIGGPYADLSTIDWSPDQSTVAVAYSRGSTPTVELVASDGSGSRRTVDIPAMMPTWRPPGGAELLFRGRQKGAWGFFLLDATDGRQTRLAIKGDAIEGGDYDLHGPAWSPTGDRLAYHSLVALPESRAQTPGFRIFVAHIAADGTVTEHQRLGLDPTVDDELSPVFTPDGRSFVFQRRMGLTEDPPHPDTVDSLFIMPADGQATPLNLGVDSNPGQGFSWAIAPDGRSLLVHRFAENDQWLVDPTSGTAVKTDISSTGGVSWQRTAP